MNPSSFKFACPTCGQRISTTLSAVGTNGACPSCHTDLVVPNASDLPGAALKFPIQGRNTAPKLGVLVIGMIFYIAVDFDSVAAGFGQWPSSSGIAVAIIWRFIDGACAGVALASISPRRVAQHAIWTVLVFDSVAVIWAILPLFLAGIAGAENSQLRLLAVIAATLATFSALLHVSMDFAWIAGASLMGMLMRRHARPVKRVVLGGIPDVWEPLPRRRLALFFSFMALVTILPIIQKWRVAVVLREALSTSTDLAAAPIAAYWGFGIGMIWTAALALGIVSLVRRSFPRHASEVLLRGGRFFVWLRPFDVDDVPAALTSKIELVFGAWKLLLGRTIEQRLAKCFQKAAGLIAIGRPQESLPPLGAARLYASDEDWQNVALALMNRSNGILLHHGAGGATMWEWSAACALPDRRKLILCLHIMGSGKRERMKRYGKLRSQIEEVTGILLPEFVDKRSFCYFEKHDGAQSMWLSRKSLIPPDHLLIEPLARLRKLRLSYASTDFRGIGILILVVIVFLIIFFHFMRQYRS